MRFSKCLRVGRLGEGRGDLSQTNIGGQDNKLGYLKELDGFV